MIRICLVCFLITFSLNAQSEDLSRPNAPSSIFANDGDLREEFINEIKNDDSLSAEEKKAYISLVDPEQAEGDAALELIDQETLEWFYGVQEDNSPEAKLWDAARVGNISLSTCKTFALCIYISKARQRLFAYKNGNRIAGVHNTPVSTARPGKVTPTGTFSIGEIAGRWRTSSLYPGAALYYAMQLNGNIFLHATSKDNYDKLGSPASAGCIRTTLAVAEPLNQLMRRVGRGNIRVIVTNN